MKKTFAKTAAACGLCLTLLASGVSAGAAYNVGVQNRLGGNASQQTAMFGGQQNSQLGGMMQGGQFVQMQGNVTYASSAGEVVTGATTNSAASLTADYSNAETITMSESNSQVKITEAGTYIVTGSCSDGNITVKKGVTGVVLVLQDLSLTSATGATLSVNKGAEAKIVISGSVTLTDAEDSANEDSDDYDGAAIKVKSGASAYITGDGTLTVNGSAKNGIKVSANEDDGNGSLVIDGATIHITATNDAINAEYDLAILSGKLTITAGDDAIHADRILTIGEDGNGPTITVKSCNEGIEATVVNLAGGTINVTSTDDGVNAANSDGTYASLGYSINVTGANVTVSAPRADGFDSNGNINLISGSATISSANNGGDAGLDYDGQLYVSDEFELNNYSGVTSMGAMGGMMGGMPGQQAQGQMNQNTNQNQQNTAPSQNMNQAPTQNQQNTAPTPNRQFQNNAQSPMQNQQSMTQNQQNMMQNRMPMQNQSMGQPGGMNGNQAAGGMWINGRWVPAWMLQQMMR